MNQTKSLANKVASQWEVAKVSGGNKDDLARAVAQIRSIVKTEREIFSVSSSALSSSKKK